MVVATGTTIRPQWQLILQILFGLCFFSLLKMKLSLAIIISGLLCNVLVVFVNWSFIKETIENIQMNLVM
jgi:hypothetical protein